MRSRRRRALALVALSALMLSGGSDLPPPLLQTAVATVGVVGLRADLALVPRSVQESAKESERVEESLAQVNPALSSWDRTRISAAVVRYSEQYGLEPDLVTAVMLVESAARPWAHSPKGALGLMQVMPHMMRPLGLAGNAATIESNIEAGCYILSSNIRRLGVERGISAYFWGSQIRGVAYLEKVLRARDRVRSQRAS